MTITTTQRHTPAESVNERTSGRRIDAVQQFVSFRITETGNTDEAGKFTITHTPIGSLARQFDTLSRINREPDLVALTADDQTLYTGEFDQDDKTIELYTDVAKTTPAENLAGVKVSYWYYAPIKGTLNDDGTFTPEAIITPVDSDGNEKFTDANPGAVQLTGSYVEIGGVSFAVSGGDTLRGKSADKPDAAAAHAVIPYCFYFSIDTGVIEVTDGTNWVVI